MLTLSPCCLVLCDAAAWRAAKTFPPAILLVPLLDYTSIDETYDLIIGIDGVRVRDSLDYQDRTRDLMAGE